MPLTLLSCLGKILERIIQRRLQYFVEKNVLLSKSQFGIRKGESTLNIHVK